MVSRHSDDFVIVKSAASGAPDARGFAIVGPGLSPQGIPFASLAEAEARGRQIAQSSRVSLWNLTAPDELLLVATYRR